MHRSGDQVEVDDETIERMEKALADVHMESILAIPHARVPIVKFTDPVSYVPPV